MTNTFSVNDKKYEAKPFDFNMQCDLEDLGLSLSDAAGKQAKLLRAYFSLCSGLTQEEAGKEINEHVIKYGNMEELSEALNKEIEESGFFQALSERAETTGGTDKTEKK